MNDIVFITVWYLNLSVSLSDNQIFRGSWEIQRNVGNEMLYIHKLITSLNTKAFSQSEQYAFRGETTTSLLEINHILFCY